MGAVGTPRAVRFAWAANTVCLAVYLAWLACGGRESLFYDRDGILGLLPVIPIVFVYIYLFRRRGQGG